MLQKLLDWDRDTFVYLNSLGIEKYDGFWSAVTNMATWVPLILLFILLFALKFPKQEAFKKVMTVFALALFITVITYLTKIGVARLRPNNDLEINTLIRILKTPTDYSFFSGHASSSFSITVLVYLLLRKRIKWAIFFFIWPILFSMSRIYVGVHFPLDILVGIFVGVVSALLFYKIYQRYIEKHILI